MGRSEKYPRSPADASNLNLKRRIELDESCELIFSDGSDPFDLASIDLSRPPERKTLDFEIALIKNTLQTFDDIGKSQRIEALDKALGSIEFIEMNIMSAKESVQLMHDEEEEFLREKKEEKQADLALKQQDSPNVSSGNVLYDVDMTGPKLGCVFQEQRRRGKPLIIVKEVGADQVKIEAGSLLHLINGINIHDIPFETVTHMLHELPRPVKLTFVKTIDKRAMHVSSGIKGNSGNELKLYAQNIFDADSESSGDSFYDVEFTTSLLGFDVEKRGNSIFVKSRAKLIANLVEVGSWLYAINGIPIGNTPFEEVKKTIQELPRPIKFTFGNRDNMNRLSVPLPQPPSPPPPPSQLETLTHDRASSDSSSFEVEFTTPELGINFESRGGRIFVCFVQPWQENYSELVKQVEVGNLLYAINGTPIKTLTFLQVHHTIREQPRPIKLTFVKTIDKMMAMHVNSGDSFDADISYYSSSEDEFTPSQLKTSTPLEQIETATEIPTEPLAISAKAFTTSTLYDAEFTTSELGISLTNVGSLILVKKVKPTCQHASTVTVGSWLYAVNGTIVKGVFPFETVISMISLFGDFPPVRLTFGRRRNPETPSPPNPQSESDDDFYSATFSSDRLGISFSTRGFLAMVTSVDSSSEHFGTVTPFSWVHAINDSELPTELLDHKNAIQGSVDNFAKTIEAAGRPVKLTFRKPNRPNFRAFPQN